MLRSMSHLLGTADHEPICSPSSRFVDGVSRQNQHACSQRYQRFNKHRENRLNCLSDSIILAQIDQIDRRTFLHRRNAPVSCKPEFSDNLAAKSLKDRLWGLECDIDGDDPEAEKAFPGQDR